MRIHGGWAAGTPEDDEALNDQIGPFFGTPATGKSATWLGIGIYTIRDGKIAGAWFAEDILAMLFQLGTITLPT